MKLTEKAVRAVTGNGKAQKLADGGGLFLYVSPKAENPGGWRTATWAARNCWSSAPGPGSVCGRPGNDGKRPKNCCWNILILARRSGRPKPKP